MVKGNQNDRDLWKTFEKCIRKRLHRCTMEENMRLLYIMLKIWPFYRFNYDFISSICLALKRELPIMNDDELKSLFRISATNYNVSDRYDGDILLNLQNSILNKVLEKWEKRQ